MVNNLPNEELWNEFERLKSENYILRKQLDSKDRVITLLDKKIVKLEKATKEWKRDKLHYRNGKRGTIKNG